MSGTKATRRTMMTGFTITTLQVRDNTLRSLIVSKLLIILLHVVAYRKVRIRSSYYRAGLVGNQMKGAEASSKEIIERILNTNVLDRYEEYMAVKDTWVNSMYGILRSFGLSPPQRAKL